MLKELIEIWQKLSCNVAKLKILKAGTVKNQIRILRGSPKECPVGKSLTEHPYMKLKV